MTTNPTISPEELKAIYPFDLDPFQLQAIAALERDESVVVCAPTGSGKTLVGEYAIHRALRRNARVFYTTPLKALSNQKFRDFREEFGADRVGLLTGDISIERDAPIVVMTTEIFRNMLYGTRIGEVGTSLVGVEAVVLDECHYMNDKQRGTVWEESIIYCPRNIQIVALSATVANSQQLTDWLMAVHGTTELVYSTYRPVPLQFHFIDRQAIHPLLDYNTKRLNPKLKTPRGEARQQRKEIPSAGFAVSLLAQRDMLPAIFFIFSRRGCDRSVEDMSGVKFLNDAETAELKARIDAWRELNPEAVRDSQLEPLYRGIAAHHAGILPAWKVLVEELFAAGFIKVVFATETLAAGINMPARTTVISSLSKRTDRGHRLLTASEFLQMAGRAGRRGKDTIGHVVTMQTRFEKAEDAAKLATDEPDPLVSQFAPSYGMVLNLLQRHTLAEAKELVERSFGQFTASLGAQNYRVKIGQIDRDIEEAKSRLGGLDIDQLQDYQDTANTVKLERQILRELETTNSRDRLNEVVQKAKKIVPGTIVTLQGKNVRVEEPLPAVFVTKIVGASGVDALLCLGEDNYWYVATDRDLVGIHDLWANYLGKNKTPPLQNLFPPTDFPLKPGQKRHGQDFTAEIAALIPVIPPPNLAELAERQETVAQLEHKIANHPIRQVGEPGKLLKRHRRLVELETERQQVIDELNDLLARRWQEFLCLIDVLNEIGGLGELKPTHLGEAAAAIRGDNELWLAIALMSQYLDLLEPQHLAAVICALVSEPPRPDTWVNYEPSGAIMEALDQLRSPRRIVFQLQRRHQVTLPVWMEWDNIGIVENWALGVSWMQLVANTSLDEGDLVRMLRRTLDLLSQIPYVPHISEELRQNARRAIMLMDRFPVKEG